MKKTAEPNRITHDHFLLSHSWVNNDNIFMLNSKKNKKIKQNSVRGTIAEDTVPMDEFTSFGGQLEESMVLYDKNSHKLSISLCLYKSLRVVAEIYEMNGHLLTRFFDRNLGKGRLVIDQFVNSFSSGILVVLLNSSEGRKYFKIVID
jgi:hypothetical protein